MKLEELKEYYGTFTKMNRELNIGSSTYQTWRKNGCIPFATQCLIEKKTNRKFKADLDDVK